LGLEGFDWVFLDGVSVGVALIVIEINQVGCPIVLVVWAMLWAVPSKVSYLSTLEASI